MSTIVCEAFDTFLYMDTFIERVAELVASMGKPVRGQQTRLSKIARCSRAMVGKWLNGEAAELQRPKMQKTPDSVIEVRNK